MRGSRMEKRRVYVNFSLSATLLGGLHHPTPLSGRLLRPQRPRTPDYYNKPLLQMSTGGHIPDEIMREILVRLPTKSLGRFKLVSKSWRALISDPKFAQTHLTLNKRRRPKLLLSDGQFFDVVDIDGEPYISSSKIDFKETHMWISVFGSCDGLVLIRGNYYELFLLNPTTRESKKLPDSMEVHLNGSISYGLGYDSTSDDYKVVAFGSGVVYVYSLRSDSWKVVQASPFGGNNDDVFLDRRPGISLNDSIHWFCYLDSSVSIVAFDLAIEKFKIVPHPHAFDPLEHQVPYLTLYEVGGCLCLFKDYSQEIDVWVMKDYGVESSWTKFRRVTTWAVDGIYPIFYLCDKELVLMHNKARGIKIVTYNVKEKTSRSVTFDGVVCPLYKCTFLDSLFSPQQFNRGTTTFLH